MSNSFLHDEAKIASFQDELNVHNTENV